MEREDIIRHYSRQLLDDASHLFGVSRDDLTLVPGYEGCANLVYTYQKDMQPRILRISFRPDRSAEQIQAELHFINYLSEHGVRVSKPLLSQNGKFLETLQIGETTLHAVSFARGKGMRVPDNGYRYREDAPIEEYFQNWGRILGQMHALAKNYQPATTLRARPEWFDIHKSRLQVASQLPGRLAHVSAQIHALFAEIMALPKARDSYGLVHGDFNDGNFTVDFTNGNITVFDFDDCCHFWFVYELAAAWEGGVGRTMFTGLEQRRAFMDRYMEQVMDGYNQENSLSSEWLARLPLFTRLLQVEEFLHFAKYLDTPDQEMQDQLNYKIHCIEQEIPFMGFLDRIYSPDRPFSL